MTARTTPPFRADIVGSFLRPEKLKEARRRAGMELDFTADREGDGPLSQQELKTVENECISEIIKFQESIGLITTKTPENDDRITSMRRIDEASKYVKIENLCLSPQCGFASAARGNPVSFDDQKRKLELILCVADEVWGSE